MAVQAQKTARSQKQFQASPPGCYGLAFGDLPLDLPVRAAGQRHRALPVIHVTGTRRDDVLRSHGRWASEPSQKNQCKD